MSTCTPLNMASTKQWFQFRRAARGSDQKYNAPQIESHLSGGSRRMEGLKEDFCTDAIAKKRKNETFEELGV